MKVSEIHQLATALSQVNIAEKLQTASKIALIKNRIAVKKIVEEWETLITESQKVAKEQSELEQLVNPTWNEEREVELAKLPESELVQIVDNMPLPLAAYVYEFLVK